MGEPNRSLLGLLIALSTLTACGVATRTTRVVSRDGTPLDGVLVISNKWPEMFRYGGVSAYVSNAEGSARLIREGEVIACKEGYHVHRGIGSARIVMYERSGQPPQATEVREEDVNIVDDSPLMVRFFPEVNAVAEVIGYREVRIQSIGDQLVESPSFYFERTSASERVSEVTGTTEANCYAYADDGSIYKIGVIGTGRWGVSHGSSPTNWYRSVEVKWAKVSADRMIVEPMDSPARMPWVGRTYGTHFDPDLPRLLAALRAAIDRGEIEDDDRDLDRSRGLLSTIESMLEPKRPD